MDSALVHAAADGDASMVEILLSQGARVDARDQGFTPLLVAAKYGHLQVGVGDKHRLMQCEQDVFFIGPESDHWLCSSVTHSLTH